MYTYINERNCWMMCNKCIYLKNLSLNPFPSHRLYFKLLPLPWRQRRINLPVLAREKHRLKLSTRSWVIEREQNELLLSKKNKQWKIYNRSKLMGAFFRGNCVSSHCSSLPLPALLLCAVHCINCINKFCH